jgi:hypothetical protein
MAHHTADKLIGQRGKLGDSKPSHRHSLQTLSKRAIIAKTPLTCLILFIHVITLLSI